MNIVEKEEQEKARLEQNIITSKTLSPLWMQNFRNNLPYILEDKRTLNSLRIDPSVRKGIVVGNGPSIEDQKLLDRLTTKGFYGLVISCDTALKKCLHKNIAVSGVVSIDGSPIISSFYAGLHELRILAILAATVHPSVTQILRSLGAKITWFIGSLGSENTILSVDDAMHLMTRTEDFAGLNVLGTGGNCGFAAMMIAAMFPSIESIALIGFDMGYPENYPKEETAYYKRMLNRYGSKEIVDGKFKYYESNDDNNNSKSMKGYTDPVFDVYRNITIETIKGMRQEVTNCSEQGTLWGEKVKQMPIEEWLDGASNNG